MNHIRKKIGHLLIVLVLGIWIDQWTKLWIKSTIPSGFMRQVTSFLNLVHVWNPGISFGLFPCHSWMACFMLIGVSAIFVLIFLRLYWTTSCLLKHWGTLFILAGACGNLIDRLRFYAVLDFISLHWGKWAFPAFNVADMLVSMGFLTLMCDNFQWKVFGPQKDTF